MQVLKYHASIPCIVEEIKEKQFFSRMCHEVVMQYKLPQLFFVRDIVADQRLYYSKAKQPFQFCGKRVDPVGVMINMHFPWIWGDVYSVLYVSFLGNNGKDVLFLDYDIMYGERYDKLINAYVSLKRTRDLYGGIEHGLTEAAMMTIKQAYNSCSSVQIAPTFEHRIYEKILERVCRDNRT